MSRVIAGDIAAISHVRPISLRYRSNIVVLQFEKYRRRKVQEA